MIGFIVGPYFTRELPNGQLLKKEDNIWAARHVSLELWKRGIPNICPHMNTQDFEQEEKEDSKFVTGYLQIIRRVDFIILLPNWRRSANSVKEFAEAKACGLSVYHGLAEFLEKARGEILSAPSDVGEKEP